MKMNKSLDNANELKSLDNTNKREWLYNVSGKCSYIYSLLCLFDGVVLCFSSIRMWPRMSVFRYYTIEYKTILFIVHITCTITNGTTT